MSQPVKNISDVFAGALFLGFGALFAAIASQYQIGSATSMGPGYFPLLLAALLGGIGVYQLLCNFDKAAISLAIKSYAKSAVSGKVLRTFGLIIAAVLLFGLFAEQIGFAAATLLLTLISGLAYQHAKIGEVALLAPLLTLISVLVFSFGLDLPLPILPLQG